MTTATDSYRIFLDAAVEVAASDAASVQVYDAQRGGLRLAGWRGFHPDSAAFWDLVVPESASTCGMALVTGDRVVVPDLETEEGLAGTEDLREYRRSRLGAVQSTPLIGEGGVVVGMISTHWRRAHEPSAAELRRIDELARRCASAVVQARGQLDERLHHWQSTALDLLREVNLRIRELAGNVDALARGDTPQDYLCECGCGGRVALTSSEVDARIAAQRPLTADGHIVTRGQTVGQLPRALRNDASALRAEARQRTPEDRRTPKRRIRRPPDIDVGASAPTPLVDRHDERAALDSLLTRTRAGESGALVLYGPAGIGKTTLLDYAADPASGVQVLRVGGVESEFELQFAGVHQLLGPVLDHVGELPEPQREALESALGRVGGDASDRFIVGLAVLTLLSHASAKTPLLCLIDDADILDEASAQVLGFTARRLDSESVLMLFASTLPVTGTPLAGLPTLEIQGLSSEASSELLDLTVTSTLADEVRARLVLELEGNPLALLELVDDLTPMQLSGAAALPAVLPLTDRLRDAALRDVRVLPANVQRLLVLVASDRSGEQDLLERAAELLDLEPATFAAAAAILRSGRQITFRHALVRSAVYASASDEDRRASHLALAGAMDPVADRDRSIWHTAAASTPPDEGVANDLEVAASLAKRGGGHAAAAAYLELAARFTADEPVRLGRLIDAAQELVDSGDLQGASALLARMAPEQLDDLQRARVRAVNAELELATGEWRSSDLLLHAADELEPFDLPKARKAYLQGFMTALFVGRLGPHDGVVDAARAVRAVPAIVSDEANGTGLLLEGYGLLFGEGAVAAAAPVLRRALDVIHRRGDLDSLGAAYQAALEVWDDDALHSLAQRRTDVARATGALVTLPAALSQLGYFELLAGRFDVAESCYQEASEMIRSTEGTGVVGSSQIGFLSLAVWRGEESRARLLAEVCASDGVARGLGAFVGFARYASSILDLGLGNYRAALDAAQNACMDSMLVTRVLPELAEAAVRCGEPAVASTAADKLAESTRASGTEWALGMLARTQALVADDAEAEALYRAALDHLSGCRARTSLARTHLVYGEWLRRRRRRVDAREQLRTACVMFESMGAGAFARRAETELVATGERARRRTPETILSLTPHEWRIATMVSEGMRNSEVAAQLYISPRTVEYHLGKVFRKLGVSSRTELAGAMLGARLERDDS
jgi:DNA-binding CsgD family transcriptional regulator/glycosyltransferase involved in cell wall biosynthesis